MKEIERLDEAANFLMLVSDEQKDLNGVCHLTPAEALEMLQPLHAMIDEEIKKGTHIVTPRHLRDCEDNCHCGVYSDLARDKQLKNDLFKLAETFPKKQQISCAKKTAAWFCKDKLLNTLKSEIKSSGVNGL
ncbi:MAG: hypothetical protein WC635_03725 [Bacteriovorax sp.]|jgi:hypothetical protein